MGNSENPIFNIENIGLTKEVKALLLPSSLLWSRCVSSISEELNNLPEFLKANFDLYNETGQIIKQGLDKVETNPTNIYYVGNKLKFYELVAFADNNFFAFERGDSRMDKVYLYDPKNRFEVEINRFQGLTPIDFYLTDLNKSSHFKQVTVTPNPRLKNASVFAQWYQKATRPLWNRQISNSGYIASKFVELPKEYLKI